MSELEKHELDLFCHCCFSLGLVMLDRDEPASPGVTRGYRALRHVRQPRAPCVMLLRAAPKRPLLPRSVSAP